MYLEHGHCQPRTCNFSFVKKFHLSICIGFHYMLLKIKLLCLCVSLLCGYGSDDVFCLSRPSLRNFASKLGIWLH
jgi:hypothetical protein